MTMAGRMRCGRSEPPLESWKSRKKSSVRRPVLLVVVVVVLVKSISIVMKS